MYDISKRSIKPLISIVVPVFNERETVGHFVEKISALFKNFTGADHEVIFVDDGSTDSTLELILQLQRVHQSIRVVELSRNFGKEAALSAGLELCSGHVIVPMDVDLQDPPELILPMLEKWREGFDVVLGKRTDRDADSFLKRNSASLFYRLHNKISEPKIPENVGDFRLMDRAVIDVLKQLPESRRFMKGLFAWIGFRTTELEYKRPPRIAGKTKFSGWRLWNFALEGITSFSTDPLKIWTYIGLLVASISFIFSIFLVVRVLIQGVDVPGYASIMVAVTFLGGLQLIGIGIIGEYLGRSYLESKRRPVYVVRKIYDPEVLNGS